MAKSADSIKANMPSFYRTTDVQYDRVVDHVINGRVEGQTIRNLCPTVNTTNVMNPNSCIIVDDDNMTITINTDGINKINPDLPYVRSSVVEPGKEYIIKYWVYENTLNADLQLVVGNTSLACALSTQVIIPVGFTGVAEKIVRVKSDTTGCTSLIRTYFPTTTSGNIVYSVALFDIGSKTPDMPIPFGLNSTKATITNNNIRHEFYMNEDDKIAGKVLDLGGIGNARNTLEFREDGSAVYIKNVDIKRLRPISSEVKISEVFTTEDIIAFTIKAPQNAKLGEWENCLCNKLNSLSNTEYPSIVEKVGIGIGTVAIGVKLLKTDLQTLDVSGIVSYFNDNVIELCYQLDTPTITIIPKELVPKIYTSATRINEFESSSPVQPAKAIFTLQNSIKATGSDIFEFMNYPVVLTEPAIKKSVIGAIIDAIGSEIDATYSRLIRVNNMFGVSTTNGSDLDRRWGDLLAMPRKVGEEDEVYRNRLKIAMAGLSNGTASALKYAISVAMGITDNALINQLIKIYDAWEYDGPYYVDKEYGHIMCIVDLNNGDYSQYSDITFAVRDAIINAKSAGVIVHTVFTNFRIKDYASMNKYKYQELSGIKYNQLGIVQNDGKEYIYGKLS